MGVFTRYAVAVAGLASHALAFCDYGTALHPRQEGQVAVGTFAYIGAKVGQIRGRTRQPSRLCSLRCLSLTTDVVSAAQGPTNWLALDTAANGLCATGKNQSPIDMLPGAFTVVNGADLAFNIPDIPTTEFENLGVTVEVVASGTMNVPDKGQFQLKQFHFHLPSEHLDNGTSSAMELHTVWGNDAGETTVVGVYIDIDETAVATTRSGRIGASSACVVNVASLGGLGRELFNCLVGKTRIKRAATAIVAGGVTQVVTNVLERVEEIATPGTATEIGPLQMSELQSILTAATFQS